MPIPMIDEQNNNSNNEMNLTLDENNKSNNDKIEEKKDLQGANTIITKNDISSTENVIKLFEKVCPKFLEMYEIKECIGAGSESFVFKAIHSKSKKPIAIKLILNDEEKNRNYSELNIINKIKNKNIITYYGVHEIKKNELDCIIMEYAKFGNIRDFQKNILKREDISEQLLCYFTFQILNGLKYCNMCKITHFDMKPQNIIIDDYLTAKIIDFSVSLDYSKINSNKIKLPFRGTSFYMAPEVIKRKIINKKDLNKIDLYSLGVILYHLSFYTYPYNLNNEDRSDYDKIYNKITTNELTFNNEYNSFSLHFIDFLKRLLEKDINKRINIYEALNHYWIKGGNILFNEKEKILNVNSFLMNLTSNYIMSFNEYINFID